MEGEAIELSIVRNLWGFELEGLSGMHYRTLAENIDEALKMAKAYAAYLAKDPEEDHGERAVVNVWLEQNIATSATSSLLPPAVKDAGVVETNQAARLESTRPGPFDVREAEDFVEFVHTFDVGLTHSEWRLGSPERIRVGTSVPADSIEWTIEGSVEDPSNKHDGGKATTTHGKFVLKAPPAQEMNEFHQLAAKLKQLNTERDQLNRDIKSDTDKEKKLSQQHQATSRRGRSRTSNTAAQLNQTKAGP